MAQAKQSVTIASSPNPVGSGARAVGMGGAFIAVADDATAASWNPAGLIQLRRPEISFALSAFRRREDYRSDRHPEAAGMQKTFEKSINYFSIAYPFEVLQRNVVVSLNYQRLFEFDRSIKTSLLIKDLSRSYRQKIDFQQEGKLSAISPALAIHITPDLAIGFTFNFWTDHLFWSNGWTSKTKLEGSLSSNGKILTRSKGTYYERYHDFTGFNMHLGSLWQINRYVTLGAVVKTPFTGDLKHKRRHEETIMSVFGNSYTETFRFKENVELNMPLSFGFGIAVRFTDSLTMSLDVFKTKWSHFVLEDGAGNRINPITGKPTHETHIKSTQQVRLGAEYLFILTRTIVPVRCGLFYDPEPSEKNPEDFWGFSVGTGLSMGDLIIDVAYQFRRGEDVEGDVIGVPGTKADVTQNLFLVSAIYHF
jgi:long-subunit fatty acid transport protein